MKEVSVIVRCYNEEAHIGRLLNGLMQQTNQGLEIIAVDSGSTDATLDIVNKFPVKVVHIANVDFSFGRSLNMGCETASSEFLVFASRRL